MKSNKKTMIRIYPMKNYFIKMAVAFSFIITMLLLMCVGFYNSGDRMISYIEVGALFAIILFFWIYSFIFGIMVPTYMDEEKICRRVGMKKIVWYWKDMQIVYVRRANHLLVTPLAPICMAIASSKNKKMVAFEPTAKNLTIILSVCTNEKIRNQITNYECNEILFF